MDPCAPRGAGGAAGARVGLIGGDPIMCDAHRSAALRSQVEGGEGGKNKISAQEPDGGRERAKR